MVKKWHASLLKNIEWYRKWHEQKDVSLTHWVILVGIAFFASFELFIQFAYPANLIEAENIAAIISAEQFKEERTALLAQIPPAMEIIVGYEKHTPRSRRDDIEASEQLTKKKDLSAIDMNVYTISTDDAPQEVVNRMKIKYKGDIAYAEVDRAILPEYMPNDPSFSSEWHIPRVFASTAWDSATGTDVVIAVLDTGVDCTHLDLAPNCLPGWNVVSGNSDASDVYGHGTAVAGTIAAAGDNGAFVVGVSYGAKILPIRITNDAQQGLASISDIAGAIIYAADHGARIANLSYMAYDSSAVQSAAQYFAQRGGLLTMSAGNYGTESLGANDPNIIVVTATDMGDVRTSWSNYGFPMDLAAPGLAIYTTARGGGVISKSGTSFSAPVVAGALGLLRSAYPTLSSSQIQNVLFSTADDLGPTGWDKEYGWGRINIARALSSLSSLSTFADTISPTPPMNIHTLINDGLQVSLSWEPSVDNIAVAGYRIFRNNTSFGETQTPQFTDTQISSQTTYQYTVSAYDAAGNISLPSDTLSVSTPAPSLSVTAYSVALKGKNSATISWTTSIPSTGVVRYGTAPNALTAEVGTAQLAVAQAVTLSSLKSRTLYYYQIDAIDSSGQHALSPVAEFKTKGR